jgi:hypothetical protein
MKRFFAKSQINLEQAKRKLTKSELSTTVRPSVPNVWVPPLNNVLRGTFTPHLNNIDVPVVLYIFEHPSPQKLGNFVHV